MIMADNRRRDEFMANVIQGLATTNQNNNNPSSGNNTRERNYNVMPDLSQRISKFEGSGGSHEVKEWLRTLNGMRARQHWSNDIALETATMNLTRGAKNWYRLIADRITTFEEFETEFRNTFLINESVTVRWNKMQSRVQGKDGDVTDYFYSKAQKCARLGLDFAGRREQILGLWSRELYGAMAARNHVDLNDLYHSIMADEEMRTQRTNRIKMQHDKPASTPSTRPRTATTQQTKDTSTNVKTSSNINEIVTQESNIQEPTGREEWDEEILHINCVTETTEDAVSKYLKPVLLGEHQVMGLIDQGSATCTIKALVVLKNDLRMIKRPLDLRSFGPEHCQVHSPGIITEDVIIDGVQVSAVDFRIVPDDAQATDVIIGRTFTDHTTVNYHKIGNELKFEAVD